jgi:ubiquinone/menaquinone biosynthesis C-methylase UbiE
VIGWVYDLLGRSAERGELGELRRNLLAEVEGDVLEIGAGTGANLPHYRRAARVVALEPDARMSRRLPAKSKAAAVPVEFVTGHAERLPFDDASFDAVVSTFVLCSVECPAAALTEIRRVLRREGHLVVLEHVRAEGRRGRWQARLTPVHRKLAGNCHLARDTRSAIEQAGFDASRVTPTRLPGAHPLVRAGIQGVATRISS